MKKTKEQIIAKKRRRKNIKIFPIYKTVSWDLLFYFPIIFLFLTQIKGFSPSQVLLADSFYTLANTFWQIPIINVVDRIAVNYATILEFRQTEDKDIIDVALKATKKDYIIDEKTQNVLQGNKTQDRITVYKMTFERTKGKLTKKGTEELDAKNCPNCGAPLKITSSGKCEYCGSIVSTGIHDWVLSNIEPLRK